MKTKQSWLFLPMVGGFVLLAYLTAQALAQALYRFGFLISPKLLFYIAIVGLFLGLAQAWVLPWSGFLLRWTAARPGISLQRDLHGARDTGHAFVVKTRGGYRATFEIPLPFLESADLGRKTHRLLRPLFRCPVLAFALFEDSVPEHQYKVDGGAEPQLRKTLAMENRRLAAVPARGRVRLQVCVTVVTPEEALALKDGTPALQPLAWRDFAEGFFQLFQQPGAVAHAEARAGGLPAVVETPAGRFLPLLVADYAEGYEHRYNHRRFQGLEEALNRPIFWHSLVFPYTAWETTRVGLVAGLEGLFPKGLVPDAVEEALRETPKRVRALKQQLQSARKPRLLKQVVWIRLADHDQPRALADRAREHLLDQHLVLAPVNPRLALRYFACLHPGLERFSADGLQGLGLGGEEEELFAELEALSHWPGHDTANLILESDAGKALPFGLFAKGANNYNLIITGESGSGKSVLAAGMVASHLARSRFNRAVIVDYGGSFTGLTAALGGTQISFQDRGRFRMSPLPALAPVLSEEAFREQFSDQDYETYQANAEVLNLALKKQTLFFIKDYLCRVEIADTAVFHEAFFTFLDHHAKAGVALETALERGIAFARAAAAEAETGLAQRAYEDLVILLQELQAVIHINPFIGDTAVRFDASRLVSFNLDGFQEDEKRVLVALINLLIQQTFAEPRLGMTLFLFDEFHKFADLAKMLDETQRVTRKFGASLVLATQNPQDFEAFPSLVENANHHVVMRLKPKNRDLGPQWKIRNPELIARARTAPPADAAGYSSVHLGTTTAEGELEGAFRYRFAPPLAYLYTSKEKEKNLLRLACRLCGFGDFLDLAEAVHGKDPGRAVPIGSHLFFQRLEPLILPCYQSVRHHLGRLFRDREVNPFLDLFLQPGQEHRFETVASDEAAMQQFLEKEYAHGSA